MRNLKVVGIDEKVEENPYIEIQSTNRNELPNI
jgi:hypothetical protein